MERILPSFEKPDPRRSANMSAIKSHGNRTTERRLRGLLVRAGITGWRIGVKTLVGTPDFVFPDDKIVIFLDGCFWHGCPLCGRNPKTNKKYWKAKIERNKARDLKVSSQLRREGFKVIRLWECALRDDAAKCVRNIAKLVNQRRSKGLKS